MDSSNSVMIVTKGGQRGVVNTRAYPLDGSVTPVPMRLEKSEREVWVPTGMLEHRDDGTYYLPVDLAELETRRDLERDFEEGRVIVLPLLAEEIEVERRRVPSGGVRITRQVQEREEMVDEPGYREEIEVRRVPVNRVLDGPVSTRVEGDTLIVPVVEEVPVVEKRLVLREELHVVKRRQPVHAPEQVTLRRTEVSIDRLGEEEVHGSE